MNEIKLFSRALDVYNINFEEINEQLAIPKGYVVHPACSNTRVMEFLNTLPNNYNTTFYKSWGDVTSKNRLELVIDQIKHYASTYGTDFQGEPYLKNGDPAKIDFTDCKVIAPISKEEIQSKIQKMFNSGIALNQDTIDMCLELLEELSLTLDIETIKNKEVLMYLHEKNGTLPSKPEEMVRYLVYLYTGSTLFIKDKKTISLIKGNPMMVSREIRSFGVEELSSVFYRFKPLFLAMKEENRAVINELRRLATKNHKPYQHGFWEKILSDVSLLPQALERVNTLSNFKKVTLLQTINVRKKEVGILPVLVRNQKLYVKEYQSPNKSYYSLLYDILYNSLVPIPLQEERYR